jgi:hypothetical protein
MAMRQWTNPSQPQTLQIAVFLLYMNAVFALLFGGLGSVYGLMIIAGGVAGGLGIAQEKRWGYGVALAVALLPFVLIIAGKALVTGIIGLMFDVALIALLLHPQSREYQRIWFS